MALYRLSVSIVGGRSGGSALAAAAYRSGSCFGEHDFSAKPVVWSEVLVPEGAPAWMGDRELLWTAVEDQERATRWDARQAREMTLALPRELGPEERIQVARDFAREAFVDLGMVADLAIHAPLARDGVEQPHLHALVTTRTIDPDSPSGFGPKERSWNDRALLCAWRELWADHVNDALERAGRDERVDHRSLAARHDEAMRSRDFDRAAETDREPEPKIGFKAAGWEKRGVLTERGQAWRETIARNVERSHVYATVKQWGEAAQERFLDLRERCGDLYEAVERWAEEYGERARGLARVGYVAGATLAAVAVGAAVLEQRYEGLGGEIVMEMLERVVAPDERPAVRERQGDERARPDGQPGDGARPGPEEPPEGRAAREDREVPDGERLAEIDGIAEAALDDRDDGRDRKREREDDDRDRDDEGRGR